MLNRTLKTKLIINFRKLTSDKPTSGLLSPIVVTKKNLSKLFCKRFAIVSQECSNLCDRGLGREELNMRVVFTPRALSAFSYEPFEDVASEDSSRIEIFVASKRPTFW